MSSQKNNPEIKALKKEIIEKDHLIEELSREKTSLLKIISHDIRSPFNRMFALLQLMELDFGEITEDQKKYIDQMYRSVFGGMEMVKNLRDSRAIDEGKLSIYTENIDVYSVLEEALKSMNTQAKLKGIIIDVKYDKSNPEISGDRTLLLKIFENILSNCIKYSEENAGVVIDINTNNHKTIIRFSDSGPGIPDDEIGLAFDKFRKLSSLPTLGEGTSGLGLYLSKHFTDLMNGNIELINGKKAGLNVILDFPLVKNQEE
ncbi:sensor histidine kinase [Bacteroidota bacterium]